MPVPLATRARRTPWLLAGSNATIAVWMVTAGDWLDQQSRLTAVITLGGHHQAVLWLAVFGFVLLAGLALLTAGFTTVGRTHLALLAGAGVVSLVAAAGVIALAAVLATAALVIAVVGWAVLH